MKNMEFNTLEQWPLEKINRLMQLASEMKERRFSPEHSSLIYNRSIFCFTDMLSDSDRIIVSTAVSELGGILVSLSSLYLSRRPSRSSLLNNLGYGIIINSAMLVQQKEIFSRLNNLDIPIIDIAKNLKVLSLLFYITEKYSENLDGKKILLSSESICDLSEVFPFNELIEVLNKYNVEIFLNSKVQEDNLHEVIWGDYSVINLVEREVIFDYILSFKNHDKKEESDCCIYIGKNFKDSDDTSRIDSELDVALMYVLKALIAMTVSD